MSTLRNLLLCATLSVFMAMPSHAQPSDPIEPVNRTIFVFNEYADMMVLKPAAQAYDYVIPDAGKRGVSNVLSNLEMPVIMANSILQGDPENAFSSFWSFVINSTLGIGGIFDFAGSNTDLNVRDEDFGQTLAVWGVGEGPYLVLPIFGPSNVRDTTGLVADYFMDPYNYLDSDKATIGRAAVAGLNARYKALGLIDEIYDTSLDPYATFRSAYWQRRRAQIANTHSSD